MKVIKHLTLFLLLTVTVNAQNIMTSSPYSMFGIGEIVTGLYGSNSAMGGVSTGMRSTWLLNTENPAGLTGLDTLRLFAETSAFMKSESYQSKNGNSNAFTGNMSAFTLAGRIMPHWYMAAGLTPRLLFPEYGAAGRFTRFILYKYVRRIWRTVKGLPD